MNALTTLQIALAQAAPASAPPAAPGDETQWMVWAIIAFGIALTLLVLEAFVPSGGVLSLCAIGCVVAGIFMFFRFDTMWGMVSIAVTLAAAPFVLAAFLWFLPNSPFGRAITLDAEQQLVNTDHRAGDTDGSISVGLEGEAITELRPVGACRLDGQRIDCIAQAGVIEKGTKVRVVGVEGTSIKVKAI
ncbi:MAG: NfeD family protein [Planctomycetota bacterium]